MRFTTKDAKEIINYEKKVNNTGYFAGVIKGDAYYRALEVRNLRQEEIDIIMAALVLAGVKIEFDEGK